MLDHVERRERGEADGALRVSLDVELDVPAARQGGGTAVAAVGDDRQNAGQVREPSCEQLPPDLHVIRARRIHPHRDRKTEDLAQAAPLREGALRPAWRERGERASRDCNRDSTHALTATGRLQVEALGASLRSQRVTRIVSSTAMAVA